ncbi:hypothetical protein [Pelagibacterium luteolum]|uniref:Uncharacterized protein n=1 Tax=Pelagibacterium luteolum TaxID=440168 RepID=A0A1G7XID5_9HYPH|nr:hypothetical protein [Pelagibacterium luteolum]SDG83942.1 hypothetical protein SAMN04487974_109136 [Pelagibacterium luteolum]
MSIPLFMKLPAVEIAIRKHRYEGRWRIKQVVTKRFEVAIDPLSIRFMESDGAFTRIHSDHCTIDVAMSVDDVRDAMIKAAAGAAS